MAPFKYESIYHQAAGLPDGSRQFTGDPVGGREWDIAKSNPESFLWLDGAVVPDDLAARQRGGQLLDAIGRDLGALHDEIRKLLEADEMFETRVRHVRRPESQVRDGIPPLQVPQSGIRHFRILYEEKLRQFRMERSQALQAVIREVLPRVELSESRQYLEQFQCLVSRVRSRQVEALS